MADREQIGSVCSRGHYIFFADEEVDSCGLSEVGKIYVVWDDGLDLDLAYSRGDGSEKLARENLIAECDMGLTETLAFWQDNG